MYDYVINNNHYAFIKRDKHNSPFDLRCKYIHAIESQVK